MDQGVSDSFLSYECLCSPSYWQILQSSCLSPCVGDRPASHVHRYSHLFLQKYCALCFAFWILVSDRRRYISNFNSVSAWVQSISPALSYSLHYPLHKFWIYFVTAKSTCIFLKYPSRSFTSIFRFIICETKLASVCSASCTSSDLLSLFKTASVWVVAVT